MSLMRNCILAVACVFMLAACGAQKSDPAPGEVQDIQPGDKSIIQPPSSAGSQGTGIEERNI